MNNLNPVHNFRHSCAVNMLLMGKPLTDIKNHLGHGDLKSTMVYLHLSVSRKREAQKKFIKYIRSGISDDPKIDELLNWENCVGIFFGQGEISDFDRALVLAGGWVEYADLKY